MVRPTPSGTEVGRRPGLTAPTRRANAPGAKGRARAGPRRETPSAPVQHSDAALLYGQNFSGAQVDPYTVLIFSVAFIAAVFLLHIWAKFS
eukprot:gene1377-4552_t